jgi:hypothetical protein
VAVGSVGRREALRASDLDFIPILKDSDALKVYQEFDGQIRERIAQVANLKVSRGEDLTKAITLEHLTKKETIGGDEDSDTCLTKRVLILSESAQCGGGISIGDVRNRVLDAYAESERTSGRHILSLCNDLARYYRTLCINYKARVDIEEKAWAPRNAKLRHSRKFWYFSNALTIAELATSRPSGDVEYKRELLERLAAPPAMRLILAANAGKHTARLATILERYSFFLDFMSEQGNRDALADIEHGERYATTHSAYISLKLNSDVLHSEMMALLMEMDGKTRQTVLDWFLL